MNKNKFLIIIFFMFVLIGCGAKIQYNTNIDTSQQTITINIEMTVMEDDYKYVEGGRERLISIIKEKIPEDIQFSIDENNINLFKFEFYSSNYEEYQSKYKMITNQDSKSIFSISNFSEESPFKANQKIEIKDNMSYLMNWLKDGLVDSRVVSSEYVDKLISTENSYYYFNDKSSYTQSYFDQRKISILENSIYILIKKDNKVDLNVSFLISTGANKEFEESFKKYIYNKDMDIKIEKTETVYNEEECIQYNLSLVNTDISIEDSITKINHVFGQNFLVLNGRIENENSFFQTKYNQYTNIKINIRNLFDLNEIATGKVNVNVEGVRVDNKIALPIEKSIAWDKSLYEFVLHTSYIDLKYTTIIIVLVVITFAFLITRKYIKKNIRGLENCSLKEYYFKLENFIFNSIFVTQIDVENNKIIGNQFIILIRNIAKVNHGKNIEILCYIKKFLLPLGLGLMFYFANIKWISYMIFICIVLLIFIVVKVFFKYDAIELELSSGKKYYFVIGDNEDTKIKYIQLLENLDNKIIAEDVLIKKILKHSEGKIL